MSVVKVVGLTCLCAVAEHGADGTGVFDSTDGTVGVLGTGEVLVLCAGSEVGTGTGASGTVGVGLAGEARNQGTFALDSAEWFAIFHSCVIDALFVAVSPIDHDLAEWYLVVSGPDIYIKK